MSDGLTSPFHAGERALQERLGVREQLENLGQRVIRSFMPEEHSQFFKQLPFLLVGAIDEAGRPWATMLVGRPGFIESTDAEILRIAAASFDGDPIAGQLTPGKTVGVLGIDYANRRRNRLTGDIVKRSGGRLEIRVRQSFGNCPQYIQARLFEFEAGIDSVGEPRAHRRMSEIDGRAARLIEQADHFYIATYYAGDHDHPSFGADVSHRGGKPGFVRLDDSRRIAFPDFAGNFHFNTLGNIAKNPLTGMLFIDFDSGDLLYLTGRAEIIWDSPEIDTFLGAERLVTLAIEECVYIEEALPMRWSFDSYSPSLDRTGSWQEVAQGIDGGASSSEFVDYRVARIEQESDEIASFYLEPRDDESIHCHKAGQYLPIDVTTSTDQVPLRRTYTISNAPNGSWFRLSIKRERPDGAVSGFFHDQIRVGDTVRAQAPRGNFVLDAESTRPVVLVSAGVGITPMVSILEELARESAGCGCARQVWFIHGARNSATMAFGPYLKTLAADWPCLQLHVRFSQPAETDLLGHHYDSPGRVDAELIQEILPPGDYDYYLCGPSRFMASLYEGWQSRGIPASRIHHESFGPSSIPGENARNQIIASLDPTTSVDVRFEHSGVSTRWDPSRGTLLELAESEGLQPAFSCRSGTCETCKVPVLKGRVDYVDSRVAIPAQEGALICSAIPHVEESDEPESPNETLVLDI